MFSFYIALIFSTSVAYLIGSFPTAYVLAKLFRKIDIRDFGSGNVGATNALRVLGKGPAIATLAIDILKGTLVVTYLSDFFYYRYLDLFQHDFYIALMGLIVIIGHIFTIFLKFKGGKGVATTIGVFSAVAPNALICALIIWVIVFLTSRYVSLGSLIFGMVLPIFSIALGYPIYATMLAVILCGINTYTHRNNINRLVNGKESKTIIIKKRNFG